MTDPYAEIKAHFAGVGGVVVNEGKGAQGMKAGGKMFAMFYKGQLLLKFPPDRAAELIAAGQALPHDPGTGKPMKDRVLIPDSARETWIALCEESLKHSR
jgi:hypothetical protein